MQVLDVWKSPARIRSRCCKRAIVDAAGRQLQLSMVLYAERAHNVSAPSFRPVSSGRMHASCTRMPHMPRPRLPRRSVMRAARSLDVLLPRQTVAHFHVARARCTRGKLDGHEGLQGLLEESCRRSAHAVSGGQSPDDEDRDRRARSRPQNEGSAPADAELEGAGGGKKAIFPARRKRRSASPRAPLQAS